MHSIECPASSIVFVWEFYKTDDTGFTYIYTTASTACVARLKQSLIDDAVNQ